MPLVFQYGSNATSGRLNGPRRLNGRAVDQGSACTVEGFDISFDVPSQTNACAASDLIRVKGQNAWGVLYEIPDDFIRGKRMDGQRTLTEIEGPRYQEEKIKVRDKAGKEVDAVTFLVRPSERRAHLATSAAYVSWIVYGLRDHGVPEDYIAHVIQTAIQNNQGASGAISEEIRLLGTL